MKKILLLVGILSLVLSPMVFAAGLPEYSMNVANPWGSVSDEEIFYVVQGKDGYIYYTIRNVRNNATPASQTFGDKGNFQVVPGATVIAPGDPVLNTMADGNNNGWPGNGTTEPQPWVAVPTGGRTLGEPSAHFLYNNTELIGPVPGKEQIVIDVVGITGIVYRTAYGTYIDDAFNANPFGVFIGYANIAAARPFNSDTGVIQGTCPQDGWPGCSDRYTPGGTAVIVIVPGSESSAWRAIAG